MISENYQLDLKNELMKLQYNTISLKEIKILLLKLQFNLYSKSTFYLIEALILAYKSPDLLCNMGKLYEIIGIKHNIDKNKIQRSIRSSIDTMNNHISTELLCSFFHTIPTEKISPKYFFTITIEYLLNK